MSRTDALKVLFICVCVCHVCPAHPCGDNPVDVVKTYSRKIGIAPVTMLHYLKLNTPTDYKSLMHDYRRYLDCTQMVQNGYFKRSADTVIDRYESLPSQFLQSIMESSKPDESRSPKEVRNNVLIMNNVEKGDNYESTETNAAKGDKHGSRSDYAKLGDALRLTKTHVQEQLNNNNKHLQSKEAQHSRLLSLLKRSLESNKSQEWTPMGA